MQKRLAELRANYVEKLSDFSSHLKVVKDNLCNYTTDKIQRSQLEAMAHKYAGSAGTFGFESVSQSARELEDWLVSGSTAADEVDLIIVQLLENLDSAQKESSNK